jgi:hypothetical protein
MTSVVPYIDQDIKDDHPRRKTRNASKEEFIENYGSGTLRKSGKLGFDIHDAYLRERIRFEFGLGFEIIQRSRVTYSDIKLVPSKALTELGWHAERMIELRPFESDVFICKQFEIEYPDGKTKEGAGILVRKTSCSWIPQGFMVFSIVAEKQNGKFKEAINPF